MSSSQTAPENPSADAPSGDVKTMLTWRGVDADRLEQVRLHVSGARIKAYGRIIAAATDDHEAFSASYELVTNDAGVTRRLSVHLVRASGESQITITRDGEHNWLVQTPGAGTVRGDYHGAENVDLALSPMFNALPIRRHGLHGGSGSVEVPVVYLYLPEAKVEAATMRYSAGDDSVGVVSPLGSAHLTVDDNGFVVDYSGLAHRV